MSSTNPTAVAGLGIWTPKSVIFLRQYNLHKVLKDLVAGFTVGLVALPLAMAFAIASGVFRIQGRSYSARPTRSR